MGDNTVGDAFITGIAGSETPFNPNVRNQNLGRVFSDHEKVIQIVYALGDKIEVMKNKKKKEYMEAYDVHMQDVQYALHEMRLKIRDYEGVDKKAAKLQQLQNDQHFYKQEALRLDAIALVNRKKIRDMTAHLNRAERERDWLLKKLRKEKKKFKVLSRNLSAVTENGSNGDESESVFTNDSSSVDLEISSLPSSNNKTFLSPLRSAYSSSTPMDRISESKMFSGMELNDDVEESVVHRNSETLRDDFGEYLGGKGEQSSEVSSNDGDMFLGRNLGFPKVRSSSQLGLCDNGSMKSLSILSSVSDVTNITQKNWRGVNNLVKQRMVIDDMQKLLAEALNQTTNGFWEKFTRTSRTPHEVIGECVDYIDRNEYPPEELILELAALPEVFQILISMIGHNVDSRGRGRGGSFERGDNLDNRAYIAGGSEDGENSSIEGKSSHADLNSVLSCFF